MAIKSIEDIINSARSIIGENTSDEALEFMDDLSDTMTDFDTRTKDSTDWHDKYDQLDASWRKRYADRFNRGVNQDDEDEDDSYELPEPPKKTYLDLFTEVK